jgi:hypothetical protein
MAALGTVEIPPETIDAIARRVLELLPERELERLVTTTSWRGSSAQARTGFVAISASWARSGSAAEPGEARCASA